MRASKTDGIHALELQRDALIVARVDPSRLYEDRASGKRDGRPGLDTCLQSLGRDDTLVTWTLDRLGRDLYHLANFVHELTECGVGLRILAGKGTSIDTSMPNGRLMSGVFAALAEFEREPSLERARAGLAFARTRSRGGGRSYKMTTAKLRLAQAAVSRRETKVGELCAELGVTRQTLYRPVDPGRLRPDGEKLLRRQHVERGQELPVGPGETEAAKPHA